MIVKRLLDVEDEYDFSLLGISCHAKDYRLCWEINNALKIELEKGEAILTEADDEKGFATSHFYDEINHLQYVLITNKQEGKYLIPEYPQLDYFLKLSGPQHDYEIKAQKQRIQNIDLVLTVIEVKAKALKSKPNLVF